jgi:hypothetical protein
MIYPNQQKAGEEIIAYFYAGIDNVILIAYTQSGKTGTAKSVVQTLINDGTPMHEICFICGMNDNDLLNQARDEFKSLLPEENILFSKQLQTTVGLHFSYVIIDESHYASNTDSQIDKFLRSSTAERYKTLSVSATPMAELAMSRDKSVGVVQLYPGPNYYGIAEIFSQGLIYDSIDITHNQENFLDLVYDQCVLQQENGDFKFNIIRLPNQWYTRDLEEEITAFDMNIAFINHHTNFSTRAEDFNDYLRTAPKQTTLIWIYGGLRAGKQLRTEHIGFVHDTWNSGPDTIAQSLLGRVTGYNKAKHGVVCFTDLAAARLMLEWIKTGFDPAFIPSRSRAILNGYGGSSSPEDWVYHPPLIIELDRKNADYYRAAKLEHGNRYPYRETLMMDLLLSATTDRTKIENIFDHYVPGKCGGLMALTEFNVKRSFHENWENNYTKAKKGLPSGNFLTRDGMTPSPAGYYYIYLNLHTTSLQYGAALVIYKERKSAHNNCAVKYVSVNKRSRFNQPLSPLN